VRPAVVLLLIVSLPGVAAAQTSFDGTWRAVITCAPHAEDGGARGYSYGFPARIKARFEGSKGVGTRLDSRKCDFTFTKE
jgi:hypothetical protein